MAPRVLVCIEDTGVAHVVAARLMKDGVDGVVVDKPGRLVDEAKKGVSALAVQDRYPSGEAATSLLRQIRVARTEAVPAIVLLTGDIPQGDRLVLEKQYKVKEFIRIAENPIRIAQAVSAAAGHEDDVVLHPDEEKNAFDISVESVAGLDGAFDPEDDEPKTVEVSAAELQRLRIGAKPSASDGTLQDDGDTEHGAGRRNGAITSPDASGMSGRGMQGPHPVTQEAEFVVENNTSEGLLDLSRLPAPGGEADVEFLQAQPTSVQDRPAQPSPISVLAPPDSAHADGGADAAVRVDEGEPVQTQPQDFQKAQNELKKALIAERKQKEAAQKRVEELEAKLAKVGDVVPKTSGGVPTEGVFEDVRYPVLLARCRADAFTGAIVMQSGGATRNVYLKDGLPVAFHSSEPGERIGKVLVTQGRITDAQYMQATTRSVERSIKLTDALVELGWMDAETIAVEQRNLARDQIIQSFELVQGRFTVQAGATPDANTATFDFGPGEIYVQGYRRYAPTTEMLAAYEALRDKYLIANARLASFRPKLGLTGEDERLLRLLGEALTVEEAVERASVTPEAAARLLSALQALELVEEWSPGVEQFRSRIRMEKQRHAEEISNILAEARARENRMLEAFEKALSKMGAGSLQAHLDVGEAKPAAASVASSTSAGSSSSSSALSGGSSLSRTSTSSSPAASGLSGSSPASPKASPPSGGAGFIHSASAAQSVTVNEASSSSSASPTSLGAPSSSASSSMGASPSASSGSSGSGSSPGSNGTSKNARDSQQSLSVADLKYKEGVEQAAQNRLDEAEVTLREAVRLDASKPEYLTSLARVLLANPRYERAGTLPVVRSLLDRAVQIAPDFQEAADLHAQVIKEMTG